MLNRISKLEFIIFAKNIIMKSIPKYNFYKTKYGKELLIDVVEIDWIRKYINKHPVQSLSYYDITFISNGSGCLTIENEVCPLYPGEVVFSRPGDIRVWDKSNIPQGYALIFEEEFLHSFFNDPSFIQNLSYFNRNRASARISITHIYARIEILIQYIIDEINRQSKDKHILRALLYEILMLLNREYSKTHTPIEKKYGNTHLNNFIALVDNCFKTHHDTKYYADKLCITPNYLNEIVQKIIGTNAKSFIQNKITQEAKRLLSYTSLSVSEIAEDLNFGNSSYFIRVFHKQTNLTPLQYRQQTNR